MTTRPAPRESRSVRLNEREWTVADAIGRMGGNEQYSAGRGIREALRIAEQVITADSGETLSRLMDQVERERQTEVTR